MESLEEQQSTTTILDRLAKKTKISLPTKIIEDILSRLPVKSILRFRPVCKPWISRISEPSFTKLHFIRATVSNRTALFISAYDLSTRKQYLLTAARDGGSVTHLMTLDFDFADDTDILEAQHSNGLVFSTVRNLRRFSYSYVLVLNPSTRKIFELPKHSLSYCSDGSCVNRYLLGFDESRDEHKILNFRLPFERPSKPKSEIMIFSMSSYSWRKMDAEPPVGFSWNDFRILSASHRSKCLCQ